MKEHSTSAVSREQLPVSPGRAPLKILLVLPAGEQVRVTPDKPEVPRRAMLRFSVLSLTVVAALTPREHQVRIVDENVEALDFDTDCDVIGITFMTALAPRAYEIAAQFRRRGRIVVGGGYHATLCPEDAAPHFDALVVGDAEGAWERLLADCQRGELQKMYREPAGGEATSLVMNRPLTPALSMIPVNIQQPTSSAQHPVLARMAVVGRSMLDVGDWMFSSFGSGGQSVSTGTRGILRPDTRPELLQTPVPRRELLQHTARHYATINAVQAGRGCRHNCRYCSVTVFHRRRYRRRSVADVIGELRSLPRNFIFVDDNLIAEREYALELFRAMAPLRKCWVSQCSVLVADDPELLELMRAAGCCGLFIGIETASDENLAAMNKQFNHTGSYPERLRKIHRAGISIVAGMIVGMDGDDTRVFEQTLRLLQATRLDAVQLNILTPLPGTPLYADMVQAGRVTDRDWSHYDYRHVVFRPARMTAAELQAGADWLYAQFYRLDQIVSRFVRAVFTVGWRPAFLSLKLGLTYRYDNKREGIVGWNPARRVPMPLSTISAAPWPSPLPTQSG
jgi:radical SAM superfamily enzyme YgiQ (UPF0313 family)